MDFFCGFSQVDWDEVSLVSRLLRILMLYSKSPVLRRLGFTLAELLVTLGVLGILSVWAIPKLIITTQYDQEKMIKKQLMAQLYSIFLQGDLAGELDDPNTYASVGLSSSTPRVYDFIKAKMQWVQATPFNEGYSLADGWTVQWDGASAYNGWSQIMLNNGAVIGGGRAYMSGYPCGSGEIYQWFLDINGRKGPNLRNKDQVALVYARGPNMCASTQRPPYKLGYYYMTPDDTWPNEYPLM
jgi:prepilin-type N-terminal cleavage/methylation domain-containing protein